ISLVLSTATEISAEDAAISEGKANEDGDIPDNNDDDMPEELKKLLEKNGTLGESLIKIIKMGKDFSSDIWNKTLTKARNITKMARKSSETLQKSLRWIDVALDGVDKVMGGIMAIQGKASKILHLLNVLSEIEYSLPYDYQEGRVSSVMEIYYDIEVKLFDFFNPRQWTFRWFNTVLGQIEDLTYKWLDLWFPIVRRTKRAFRFMRKGIRHLQDIAPRFHEKFEPDVNVLAERLKQKIDELEKVSRKKLIKARERE
ncbi:unnamed protein product, partial [Owenia fusiformis]